MASYVGGEARARVDLDKKHRRDLELEAGSAIHTAALELIAGRIAPEIKRAFQKDITFADRILIARYDDDGGYFKRHRDNASPQVAFREFAISLNLNTHEYEGGELLFPEYNDHRYNPAAGAAVVAAEGPGEIPGHHRRERSKPALSEAGRKLESAFGSHATPTSRRP